MAREWQEEEIPYVQWLGRFLGRDWTTLRPEIPLDEYEIDSLDLVEFIMGAEDEFKIEIPDPQAPVDTLGDLVDLIRKTR